MQRIDSLMGLRAVAAYSVLVAHYSQWVLGPLSPENSGMTARLAYFGMSLFFVLSGFVIEYNYASTIRNEGARGVYAFFVARFARLYPLYIAVVIAGYLASGGDWRTMVVLPHLTLSQSWFNISDAVYGPSWSISTEWFFYIVFAIATLVLPAIRRPGMALVVLVVAAPPVLLAVFAAREPITQFITGPAAPLFIHAGNKGDLWYPWITYYSPLIRIAEFAVGVLVAKVYLANGRISGTWAIVAFAWCVGIIGFGGALNGTAFERLLPNFVYAPALAVLLLYLCQENVASWVLGRAPLVFLGEISYSVYLLQIWCVHAANGITQPEWRFAAVLLINTVVSAIVFTGFEAPARKFIRKLLIRRPKAAADHPRPARASEPQQRSVPAE